MLQSRFDHYAEPHALRDALRTSGMEHLVVTAKGSFHAELTRLETQRLLVKRVEENLPRIACAAADPARAPIAFLTDRNSGDVQHNGQVMSREDIAVFGRSAHDHLRTSGPCRGASMSLTHEDLAQTSEAIAGPEITAPSATTIIRPTPAALENLRSIHAAAVGLAKTAPELLARPAIAAAVEQELIRAMIVCLAGGRVADVKTCGLQRSMTMRRFEEYLSARPREPVYATEICRAIGVSERALRAACHERLGIGPVRYLWLRRMHLARRGLLQADASAATVTEIATGCGFWELGRFSVEYRAMFGEQPSATLRRPPDEALEPPGLLH